MLSEEQQRELLKAGFRAPPSLAADPVAGSERGLPAAEGAGLPASAELAGPTSAHAEAAAKPAAVPDAVDGSKAVTDIFVSNY